MPIKAFATGVTGYIGGDAFYQINKTFPDSIEWTCLVRNSERGAAIAAQYPSVRLVYGDLDNIDLLEHEASQADLVCNWANADHLPAAQSLLKGLSARTQSTSAPVYLIHTSGSAIISYPDIDANTYGEPSPTSFNDWDNIARLVSSIPPSAPHRTIDQAILTPPSPQINTAIVCPPCIYGRGRGPANASSSQIPGLARLTLSQRRGIRVGTGQNKWSFVHVADLAELYTALVRRALPTTPRSSDDAPDDEVWGHRGYYFASTAEYAWGEVGVWIADEARKQGLLSDEEAGVGNVMVCDREGIDALRRYGSVLWGTNSRSEAVRARKVLGWKPEGKPGVKETIAEEVAVVAREMGLSRGHAAKAAGDA